MFIVREYVYNESILSERGDPVYLEKYFMENIFQALSSVEDPACAMRIYASLLRYATTRGSVGLTVYTI